VRSAAAPEGKHSLAVLAPARRLRLAATTSAWPAACRAPLLSRVCMVIDPAELACKRINQWRRLWFSFFFVAEEPCANSSRLARRRQPTLVLHGDARRACAQARRHDRRGRGGLGRGSGAAGREARPQKWPHPAGRCRKVLAGWNQLLFPPDTLSTGSGDPIGSMGPYWRRWRQQLRKRPAATLTPPPAPSGLQDLDAAASQAAESELTQAKPAKG